MKKDEIARLQSYLQKKFRLKDLTLKVRGRITDSVEVMLGEEFIGTLTRDDEDGEVSYQLQMAILELDLDEAGV